MNRHERLRNHTVIYIILVLLIGALIVFILNLLAASRQTRVNFTESHEAFVNPFMGYAPWAINQTPESTETPNFSLAFAILSWKDFEPQKGVYDFDSFESRNNFQYLTENNIKIILRFVSDYPSDEKHMDIPEWLYDEISGSGVFYDNHGLCGFAPDYRDEYFIERHKLALAALGERYDASPDVAFIQLGSLGQWGEWHNWASPELPFPEVDITDIYVRHYLSAFKDTMLQMRRPFDIARENDIGLYNDMIGRADSTYQWLGWIKDAGMDDFYNYAPSGGELASTYSFEDYFGEMYNDLKNMVIDSHTTFIGSMPPDGVEFELNAADLLKTMGYRFTARNALFNDKLYPGKPVHIELNIENTGIAPFYYNWNFCVLLYDTDGNFIQSYEPSWDARDILPGKAVTYIADVPQSLPEGEYVVKVGLVNPETHEAEVRLANVETGGDMFLIIGNITVERWLLWK